MDLEEEAYASADVEVDDAFQVQEEVERSAGIADRQQEVVAAVIVVVVPVSLSVGVHLHSHQALVG